VFTYQSLTGGETMLTNGEIHSAILTMHVKLRLFSYLKFDP